MKHIVHFILAVAVGLMAMGCSSTSYPGLDYEYGEDGEADNNESSQRSEMGVPLHVYVRNRSFISSATKGLGPFDMRNDAGASQAQKNRYQNTVFHIFAFRDRPDEVGPFDYQPDYTKRSNDTNDAHANCLIDSPDFEQGLSAKLNLNSGEFVMKQGATLKRDTALYFGARYSDIGYNFYVYHLDDAKVTGVHREADHIGYDIDIDGTQDIMIGQSQRLRPNVLDSLYRNVQLTQEQRNKVLNIGNYSSYASYVGIEPYVPMNHLLTRLRFEAYPGSGNCHQVVIDSVLVEARHIGHLTVVHVDSNRVGGYFDDDHKWLSLKGVDTANLNDSSKVGTYQYDDLKPSSNTLVWDSTEVNLSVYDRKPLILGGDMLVPSDTLYRLKLCYHQDVLDGTVVETKRFTTPFTIKAHQIDENLVDYDEDTGLYWYRPGWIYRVRIGVYGLHTVGVSVDVDPWENGGDVIDDSTQEDFWEWVP